jgi:predicted phage terminase large subunit-like protein
MTREELVRLAAQAELSRRDFWYFCHTLSPDFYTEDREHLVVLCETLQALYEKRIVKKGGNWHIMDTPQENYCKGLIINYPPRAGKSRSLINFCMWVLGKNNAERIICASYNDDTAQEFSRYTRDGIKEAKQQQTQLVYNDIFRKTTIKKGSSSVKKWALTGQHFNYIGAGVDGGITSKGGTILIIDDPVKGIAEAINETHLAKLWQWYSGTFLSRVDTQGGEPIQIINHTRWSKNDIAGRLLQEEPEDWYVLREQAYNESTGQMLCENLLSREAYEKRKRIALLDENTKLVFYANYQQKIMTAEGILYRNLKTYEKLPERNGQLMLEEIRSYTDTADTGKDYLCSIVYGAYNQMIYVLDVYYTDKAAEVTEKKTAEFLYHNRCKVAKVESNAGGRAFARNVERILEEKYNYSSCTFIWFHQSQNKEVRINSNSAEVQKRLLFPVNWSDKWPVFFEHVSTYQRKGKYQIDDAPDTMTGVIEDQSYNTWRPQIQIT